MYRDSSVGVVVPAYNEKGYVGEVIDTTPEFVDRVYVVDDGSTDGTWAEIQAHAEALNTRREPEAPGFDEVVVPIRHERNRGVGGAIKTGYLRAREERIDVTAVMGGDAQMNPDTLDRYLDPVVEGQADYVKGNRFMRSADYEEMPRFRLAGNLMLSYLTKIASGYWKTMDPQNGYTAISLDALDTVDVEEMYEFYGYCNDLLVKLNAANLRVADVPRSSEFAYDDGWKSHIQYDEYVPRVSAMLLRNFFWRLNRKYLVRDFHPLALLYYLALGVGGVAVGKLVSSLVRFERGTGPGRWLAALLGGVVLFLAAATLDVEDNRDLERRVVPGEAGGAASDAEGEGEFGGEAITAD